MESNAIPQMTAPQPYPLVCFRDPSKSPFGQQSWLVIGWVRGGRPIVVPNTEGLRSQPAGNLGPQVLDGDVYYRLPDFDVTTSGRVEVEVAEPLRVQVVDS